MAEVSRVWMLTYTTWSYNDNGRNWCDEIIDSDCGFFLLEADAHTLADQLNLSTRKRYVAYCEKQLGDYKAKLAAREVLLSKNELLAANGFDTQQVGPEPAEPTVLDFETWVNRNEESTWAPIEVAAGKPADKTTG